jgi:hypothetical protein
MAIARSSPSNDRSVPTTKLLLASATNMGRKRINPQPAWILESPIRTERSTIFANGIGRSGVEQEQEPAVDRRLVWWNEKPHINQLYDEESSEQPDAESDEQSGVQSKAHSLARWNTTTNTCADGPIG